MVNPTTAVPEAPMSGLANLMAMKGRDNDSMLVHLSPTEVSNLNKLSGNTMTINPATGLPEGRSRFLEAALPALLSIGAGIATGGASIGVQMAAAAAASGVGAKLTGKSNEEALTSAVLGGATAGLFGGAGSAAGAGGTEAGKQVALQKGVDAVATDAGVNVSKELAAKQAQALALQQANTQALKQGLKDQALSQAGSFSGLAKFAQAPNDVYGNIASNMAGETGMSLGTALTQPGTMQGLAGIGGREMAGNAMVNQMRDDANRVYPIQEDMSNPIDIYSTPFTQTSMGPFNQQQVADNFISGGSGPYGMNYLNQAYGQEGGQVQEMNQGGLTQFNSIMGNPALQLQNPNPPMQMAGGGSASPQMGSSQGGGGMFGSFPPEMLQKLQSQVAAPQDTKSYDVLASIGANPVQAMKGGGAIGNIKDHAGNIKEKFLGSDLLEPFHKASNKMGIMKDEQYNTIQGYAGGGMAGAGQGQASVMQALQPMLQVANEQAQQAVQMKAGGNLGNYIPSVGIIGGLLDSLNSKKKDTAPNITNNYYGTSPDGQPMLMDGPPQQINTGNPMQMAGGGEIVAGLRAIADNRAFEGRVKGEGDGMSDDIPFNIEGQQPALLARDEYVIPADVVSMIGNGSSDAGSEQIDAAIANIRQAKYGRAQQPRETEGLGGLLG